MKLQFKVTFKNGTKTVAEIVGREDVVDAGNLTVQDVVENVCETEQFLERLTGLRVHIEQIY
jgi:hypothetical protein